MTVGVAPARRTASAVGEIVAGILVAVVVATVGLYAFSLVQWPAFNSSNVTRALTTLGQVVAAALFATSIYLYRIHKWPWIARLAAWVGLSGFVTVTLGMPLAATKLYLFGISVDQEFRTEYLTRLTDSASLRDMTYTDIPPFYPAGWFWLGGRVGNVLGMDGWEVFKPYAIGLLAVTSVVAFVLWKALIRSDWAVAVSAVTTALVVAYASPEAYSAVIVLLFAPALVLAWGALHREAAGGWGAAAGTGLFLGLAATFYTLYLGLAAFTVVLMALFAAVLAYRERKTWNVLVPIAIKVASIAAISGVIAATVWLPYLIDFLRGAPSTSGTALHYLPEAGATLPFPMFEFSMSGALCLIGTVWLAVRFSSSRRAQALGVGVVSIYLWTLLSMAATAAGTTLLSFRLEAVLIVLLGSAGVFGFLEGSHAIYQAINEPPKFRIAAVVVAIIGAMAFAQNIPQVLQSEITVAYSDTDGDGNRADMRPPSAVSYYREVDDAITEQTQRPRDETVVLTADTSFLSYYPYFGFQGLTSHYANPLAQFDQRADAIERWTELETPDQLIEALNTSQWRAPDAFLFRRGADGYTLRLAEDVYPNDPNVRRYTVTFPESLFEDPRFTVTDIGPFALVVRTA
ncbi:arabinofuranosyltransferase [Rhodococcus sp. 06-412-2C]|uniref:galactan 5-O-arabinofuranosyltransferase n=1 Tax=unclassified Rhodococcus (in: high G+C Gram-positive bacteria) TaxID=192944 RepID=UPI000B9A66A0|nr:MULTISPECIES: galactan 5-O-arabinofuranosyltransferase [unclassified Rhodococcus (in: high G+C Gram-positive bacteria)]OZC88566.1 arabinofuranosyltransferase [Rhodococcus sp. 06-412-2C]OZD02931.1 arabinofuranosyltransferase [Rhodococcus sp. 06-412-2B]